jgi:tripartite-type tricarboxylate transporter receptor subunit TctC
MRQLARVIYSVVAVSALAVGGAMAQTYPGKPVKIVSPFSAGGPADIYARYLGPRLEKALGQPSTRTSRSGRRWSSSPT